MGRQPGGRAAFDTPFDPPETFGEPAQSNDRIDTTLGKAKS